MAIWNWHGSSGRAYACAVFPKHAIWHDVPGIYLFANGPMLGATTYQTALYVGQCESFLRCLSAHERWPEAVSHGANKVHAMVVHNYIDRNHIERDLISALKPIMNTHVANDTRHIDRRGAGVNAVGDGGFAP
jgi:hypothetical protein